MEKLSLMTVFAGSKRRFPLESLIDTRASISAIPQALAEVIGARYTGRKLKVHVANGKNVLCPLAKVRLSIPALRCSSTITAAVVNAEIPPLLGSDFLQIKKITVDYRDHSIRYRGRRHKFVYIF